VFKDHLDHRAYLDRQVLLALQVPLGRRVSLGGQVLMAGRATEESLGTLANRVSPVFLACLGLLEILAGSVLLVHPALVACQDSLELLEQQASQVSSSLNLQHSVVMP